MLLPGFVLPTWLTPSGGLKGSRLRLGLSLELILLGVVGFIVVQHLLYPHIYFLFLPSGEYRLETR